MDIEDVLFKYNIKFKYINWQDFLIRITKVFYAKYAEKPKSIILGKDMIEYYGGNFKLWGIDVGVSKVLNNSVIVIGERNIMDFYYNVNLGWIEDYSCEVKEIKENKEDLSIYQKYDRFLDFGEP